MVSVEDRFEAVRRESDPLRQARLASELITLYQQRGVELARLRKEAINRAAAERGMSYASIATELGLTRGRITQIRQTAPPVERAFFGVGPVVVAAPLRMMPGRALPVISSEDSRAAERLTRLLGDLAFQVEQFRIPTDGRWEPSGDVVAICGPKSSPVTERALESDPWLVFAPDEDGIWIVRDRDSGTIYRSPMDDSKSSHKWADMAYIGRLVVEETTLLIIAGIHALGSVGAVDYLSRNLSELYSKVGTERFSMVVLSEHDGDTVLRSEIACPPRIHD